MLIRTAQIQDIVMISQLDNEVFRSDPYPFHVLRQFFDVFGELFLVATTNGQIVGYTIGAISHTPNEAWLIALAVDSNNRKRGVGKLLARSILERLSVLQARQVYLTVDPENEIAINLYSRLGFREVRREENYFGPGTRRLVMCKEMPIKN
jgi:ribosomal protein S18 acetylase RimI-like enzyme